MKALPVLLLSSLFAVATASAARPAAPLQLADAPARCAALPRMAGAALGDPSTRIDHAQMSADTTLPEHCDLIGSMRHRTGAYGQAYAIRFHLRLPRSWNGRFLFMGGGGTNGNLGTALGPPQQGLAQGFAIVSTDTGHDNGSNNVAERGGTASFGHDYQARLDYAEAALDSVATAAKKLVASFYGRPADANYFSGCSNGGREGVVFAQRFPAQFDGIVAAAPAIALPKAAVAQAWDTQAFARAATALGKARNGLPDLAGSFSAADWQLVDAAILAACDKDDGIADGMVLVPSACTRARVRPELARRLCRGGKRETCLAPAQVDALLDALDGPRSRDGKALYASWPWDAGIGAPGWLAWKIGDAGNAGRNVTLGAQSTAALFLTPPHILADRPEDGLRFQLGFDFDADAAGIFATAPGFPRSSWDMIGVRSADLAEFAARGGRMIVPHGGSDPVFSLLDTIAWWRSVDAAAGGKAANFVRVFPVPGMNHCGGGPATDRYDALAALIAWVEQGRAPDAIPASAGPGTPWPGRRRPLCAYPTMPHYRGGDIEAAESFACTLADRRQRRGSELPVKP